jgi:hypothetical protein
VLGWVTPALRHPEQAERWTWVLLAAYAQLVLARHLARDQRYPWERRHHRRLSPGRVRRDYARVLPIIGTPATPLKPSKAPTMELLYGARYSPHDNPVDASGPP